MVNYRKLVMGDNINKETKIILEKIGRWHSLTPKLWREGHKVSDEDIKAVVEEVIDTNKEDLMIVLGEDNLGELKGFIWACRDEEYKDVVNIVSLYVDKDSRRKGIAQELKKILDKWCKESETKLIKTTVHHKNKNMLKLNEKLGYEKEMIVMTKRL